MQKFDDIKFCWIFRVFKFSLKKHWFCAYHCEPFFWKTAWQSINFRQKPKIYHIDLSCHTEHSLCHTERSEVSTNSKCILNSLDFSLCANALRSKWQNQVLFIVRLRLASCKENVTYQNPCFVARLCLLCSLFSETAQKHAQKVAQIYNKAI